MSILFRVDSSAKIGLGHLMRCLVLAKQYKKHRITFCSYEIDETIVHNNGYNLIKLKTKNIDEFILHVKKNNPSLVIIDTYEIKYQAEKMLKQTSACTLMVLDDTYQKHYADILLNHNIYAKKKLYKNKIPAFCKLHCGKKYTLIRDEFKKEKNKIHTKNGVFLALGGSDAKNLTLKILKKLPTSLHVKVVTTSTNQNLDKLVNYAKKYKNISLHVNSKNIAKLMNKSSFAIISPSVIAHEALYLKLPFLAIKTAKNQAYMYEYLKQKGFTCIDNLDELNIDEIKSYL